MSTLVLEGTGLPAPPSFPAAVYNAALEHARRRATAPRYGDLSAGLRALAYRFAAAMNASDAFDHLVAAHGHAPAPLERFRQEDALFAAFSAAFSCIECICYATFSTGALLNPYDFPMGNPVELRRINPRSTLEMLQRAHPAEPITAALANALADPAVIELQYKRNVLTHRTAPGRIINVGGDAALPARWKLDNKDLDGVTGVLKAELSRAVNTLLPALEAFTAKL